MRRLLLALLAVLLGALDASAQQYGPWSGVTPPVFVSRPSAVNGSGEFSGQLLAPATPTDCSAPPYTFQGDTTTGLSYGPFGSRPQICSGGSRVAVFGQNYIGLGADAFLHRDDAAHVLGQRAGTTAQRWNVYNTYTSSTNSETFAVDWKTTANVNIIGNRTASTGTGRIMRLVTQDANANAAGLVLEMNRDVTATGLFRFTYGNISTGVAANYGNATPLMVLNPTNVATSGSPVIMSITPTYNQSGNPPTANTDLLINRTETAVGSGAQNLWDARVGNTSRMRLTNTGTLIGLTSGVGSAVYALATTTSGDDPTEFYQQNRVTTTNATVTTLATIAIPATTTVGIECVVVNRRTGGASGTAEDGAYYKINVAMKNVAGTATEIAAETLTVYGESQAAWTVTAAPSSGNELIQVTGAANNDITWHSHCRTYPVGS